MTSHVDSTNTSGAGSPRWRPMGRFAFRLGFAYALIFIFVPSSVWRGLVPQLAAGLGIELSHWPNGSGDTTFNYVQLGASVALAVLAALVWSIADRKREAYDELLAWTRVGLRLYLAFMMFGYGFSKLFRVQFDEPSLETLVQPIGDASPMGVVWLLMGLSPVYEVIAGLLELTAALLLCWRRTAAVGALLACVVMGNVVLLNYCFDVPVKLLSTHLLLMAVVVASFDARPLFSLLILRQVTEPAPTRPLFERQWLNTTAEVGKLLGLASLIIPNIYFGVVRYDEFGPNRPRSPLYGIYEVREMIEDGQPRPGRIDDPSRWRYVIFDEVDRISVQLMDGSFARYDVELDRAAGTMTLSERADHYVRYEIGAESAEPPPVHEWTLIEGPDGVLELRGMMDDRVLELQLVMDDTDFVLTSRGFRWISETPFNR
jgi:hypothetical protein